MLKFFPVIVTASCIFLLFYLNSPKDTYAQSGEYVRSSGTSLVLSEQTRSKYTYIGIEKCAAICHNNDEMGFQYALVKKGPHADAFKVLGSRKALRYAGAANITVNPGDSPVCLKCHTTGSGFDPSAYAASYRKEDGVTCEACHKGPESAQTVMPQESTCLQCHSGNIHPVEKFEYERWMAEIAHPRNKIIADPGQNVKVAGILGASVTGDGKPHFPGENYGGGIVFYTFDNGMHGLIAAVADQGTGVQWCDGAGKITGSTGDGIYAGISNTEKIISYQTKDNSPGKFAAKICSDYSVIVNGVNYDDWYLPSKSELNLLYNQKDAVGGFSRAYWSSTEVDSSRAWLQYFSSGFRFSYSGKNYTGFVRAIRAF